MKFYFSIAFYFSMIILRLNGQNINNRSSQFIPLEIGNYWVYSSSEYPHRSDTIKITREKIIGSETGYYYNGNLWLERNDTLFEFQSQRNGYEFPTVQYFPSDKTITYQIVVGGDVLSHRTVTKLRSSYKVKGKEYKNCYEFTQKMDGGNEVIIISYGIGIIEIRTPYRTTYLIDHKIK
jgi:hypothetical protein